VARYRYLFADIRSASEPAELPLRGVTYERVLNGEGTWRGSLPLGAAEVDVLDPISATEPGRSTLYVERDGQLVYGGPVLRRRYASDNRELELQGKTFENLLARRTIYPSAIFENVEIFAVVRSLVASLTAREYGAIALEVSTASTGVTMTERYYDWQFKPVLETLQQLAAREKGFDFTIEVSYGTDGRPRKFLNLGYPRLGRSRGLGQVAFTYPGSISSYSWPEDAENGVNLLHGIGSGEADTMLQVTETDTDSLVRGWPIYEGTYSNQDVRIEDTLRRHAIEELRARRIPFVLPEVAVRGDQYPQVGTFALGDDVRVMINDFRFPHGVDDYFRVIGLSVSPNDKTAVEQTTLTLARTM